MSPKEQMTGFIEGNFVLFLSKDERCQDMLEIFDLSTDMGSTLLEEGHPFKPSLISRKTASSLFELEKASSLALALHLMSRSHQEGQDSESASGRNELQPVLCIPAQASHHGQLQAGGDLSSVPICQVFIGNIRSVDHFVSSQKSHVLDCHFFVFIQVSITRMLVVVQNGGNLFQGEAFNWVCLFVFYNSLEALFNVCQVCQGQF
jgi:hypothetical protein